MTQIIKVFAATIVAFTIYSLDHVRGMVMADDAYWYGTYQSLVQQIEASGNCHVNGNNVYYCD